MSDCKAFRQELGGAWDVGVLSRAARAHVESCRACGDELRGRESLLTLVGGLGKVEAPADFDYRLRARMAASKAPGGRVPLRGLRLIYAFAPVAAAACFLVITTTLYLRQASRTGQAERPTERALVAAPTSEAAQAPPAATSKRSEGSQNQSLSVARDVPKPKIFAARTTLRARHDGARPPREVAARSEVREAPSRITRDASFGSAPVLTGRGVTVKLKAPPEPLRMILRDESGAGRVVPMRAVSFGSQELIARDRTLRQPAADEDEGVW